LSVPITTALLAVASAVVMKDSSRAPRSPDAWGTSSIPETSHVKSSSAPSGENTSTRRPRPDVLDKVSSRNARATAAAHSGEPPRRVFTAPGSGHLAKIPRQQSVIEPTPATAISAHLVLYRICFPLLSKGSGEKSTRSKCREHKHCSKSK